MRYLFVALAVLLLGGCGVRPVTVRVVVPDVQANPESGPMASVAEVTDARDTAYLAQFDKATWTRNVGGVVRGGNGTNLVLASSTTADKVQQVLVQALRQMGYRTVPECGPGCLEVSATLNMFAASMPFNFWRAVSYTQKMLADLDVSVQLSRDGSVTAFEVTGHGDNIYQVVSQENWETALNRAVVDFMTNFKQGVAMHESSMVPDDQVNASK